LEEKNFVGEFSHEFKKELGEEAPIPEETKAITVIQCKFSVRLPPFEYV